MTTAVLGVAGTIIGSVLSSVLYNVLSEALEKPVTNAKFSTNFEWDIAYVFPLVVVLIIQFLLILAFLSEWGFLPSAFLNIYLSIQGVASNNLYRVLGFALVVMSVYPFILRRDLVKKSDGIIILLIGLIFLARGFSDGGSTVSYTFSVIFDYVDFPIALIAFLLLIFVINNILSSARKSEKEFNDVRNRINEDELNDLQLKNIHRKKSGRNLDDLELIQVNRRKPRRNPPRQHSRNNSDFSRNNSKRKINESIDGFQFESNDLLDDYKK